MDTEQNPDEGTPVEESALEESSEKTHTPQTKKNTIIAIVIALVLLIGALEVTGTTSFLAGFKTVAVVNGEKISQAEFNQRLNQILNSPQAQALNLTDPTVRSQVEEQILTEIVNTRLLLQKAKEAGFSATDEAVQAEYDLIVAQLGSEEILAEELRNGGLTDNEFRSNIRDQLTIQEYIGDNVDESTLVATDEEVNAFYDQISGQEGIPPLEDIRAQIEGQIVSEKQIELVGTFIGSLRETAEIEIK